jgi:hypothetical protein
LIFETLIIEKKRVKKREKKLTRGGDGCIIK